MDRQIEGWLDTKMGREADRWTVQDHE